MGLKLGQRKVLQDRYTPVKLQNEALKLQNPAGLWGEFIFEVR